MKAGLLPRLTANVVPVYLEATPHGTEERLLHALRRTCQALPEELGLRESMAWLRVRSATAEPKNYLIVIDQFEQWLHARSGERSEELVQALRQCDGRCVRCLISVRDDFWMAITRFLRDLDVRIVEGKNSAAVDLFDEAHARRVLIQFGVAYGRLPAHQADISPEQHRFLDRSVAQLARAGRCDRAGTIEPVLRDVSQPALDGLVAIVCGRRARNRRGVSRR